MQSLSDSVFSAPLHDVYHLKRRRPAVLGVPFGTEPPSLIPLAVPPQRTTVFAPAGSPPPTAGGPPVFPALTLRSPRRRHEAGQQQQCTGAALAPRPQRFFFHVPCAVECCTNRCAMVLRLDVLPPFVRILENESSKYGRVRVDLACEARVPVRLGHHAGLGARSARGAALECRARVLTATGLSVLSRTPDGARLHGLVLRPSARVIHGVQSVLGDDEWLATGFRGVGIEVRSEGRTTVDLEGEGVKIGHVLTEARKQVC
jgi:hypothetical protein